MKNYENAFGIENLQNANLNRRQFLAASALGLVAAGCATVPTQSLNEERPVHYPRLPGEKIQSPEHYGLDGCMTGIHLPRVSAKQAIENYKRMVGKDLSFLLLQYRHQSNIPDGISIPTIVDMEECAKKGVIPFVTYDARSRGTDKFIPISQIPKGKHDKRIISAAKDLKVYGEQYGGFFIRTMREMNLPHWKWGRSRSKFKKAWIHIWDIFENEGTNQYATWVFNPYVAQGYRIANSYYPGEKYVDWVGLNGYNWDGQSFGQRESFRDLFSTSEKSARKKYQGKPLMILETGMDNFSYKKEWTIDTFHTTKQFLKGIKGVAWWSEHWSSYPVKNFDSRIDSSPEALSAFKQGISDPYFLGKIPYRKI